MSESHHHHHNHHHHTASEPADGAAAPVAAKEALDPGMKALAEALRWLFAVLKGIMVLVVVLFFLSGLYRVEQSEQAVVLRFGKVEGEGSGAVKLPGLHWAWPHPIEEVIKIPASSVVRQISVDAMWYYQSEREKAGLQESSPGQTLQFVRDGYSLTASSGAAEVMKQAGKDMGISATDYNLVHTRWSIRYRVSDPKALVENLWDGTAGVFERGTGWFMVEEFLRDVLCDAVIITSANRDINKIVWEAPQQFRMEVESRVAQKLRELNVGLAASLEYIDQMPPRQVKPFFDAAASAGIEAEKFLKSAQGQADELRSQARSSATQIIAQAKAYSKTTAESAKADAAYLHEVLDKIEKKVSSKIAAGELKEDQRQKMYDDLLAETADQLYHETIRDVMGAAAETFVLSSPDQTDKELRLWINRDASLGKKAMSEKEKKN